MAIKINKLHFESDKILSSLSKEDKKSFLKYTQLLKFRKGKLIFYEEGIPTGIFLVKSGKAKIYKTGIYLTGGGALLAGLSQRLSSKTKLPVHLAEDPLRAVVRGTGITLKDIAKYKSILIK